MAKQKILFVTPYFPPDGGGLESYSSNIISFLKKNHDWDVVVVTGLRNGKRVIKERKDGVTIYRLPILFTLSNTPINPLWPLWIKKIITLEKPALINAHAPVPFISDMAALVAGKVPFVLTYHAGTMKKKRPLPDFIIHIYETFIFPCMARKAKAIICSSGFVQKTMMQNFLEKSIIIHPGVDATLFTPKKNKTYTNKSVLFIGRYANMYRMKGLYYLIDAMKRLPNATLRVIGEPITLPSTSPIQFLGIKHGKELLSELRNATVLVLPSLAHMESFGIVLIEAMACGIPVVGTNIGGIPEAISHTQDGIIVEPEDSKAIARAITTIISNPTLAKRMGQSGRQKVLKSFTWKVQASKTNDVFTKAVVA